MHKQRIFFLAALLIFGILLSIVGNTIMEIRAPVREQSSLLQNYLIMQSMAGKNASYANQTYMIGDSGIVVSFNDILNIRESPAHETKGALAANAPLTLSHLNTTNKTTPEARV
jgi:type II secretory pathway pseudopilin PulG